jgi:hypothetical protein
LQPALHFQDPRFDLVVGRDDGEPEALVGGFDVVAARLQRGVPRYRVDVVPVGVYAPLAGDEADLLDGVLGQGFVLVQVELIEDEGRVVLVEGHEDDGCGAVAGVDAHEDFLALDMLRGGRIDHMGSENSG